MPFFIIVARLNHLQKVVCVGAPSAWDGLIRVESCCSGSAFDWSMALLHIKIDKRSKGKSDGVIKKENLFE